MLASMPTELRAALAAAREALHQEHYPEAEMIAEQLLRRSTESHQAGLPAMIIEPVDELRGCALVVCGLAAERQGHTADSRRFLEDAVDIFDDLVSADQQFEATTLADYGIALLLTGRPTKAAEPLINALQSDIDVPPEMILKLAEALRRSGHTDAAVDLLRVAYQHYPRHAGIAACFAEALERAGEGVLSVDAHLTAAKLLAESDRLELSLKHLERANNLAPPDAPQSALALAQMLLLKGHLEAGEDLINTILKEHPNEAGSYALEAELLAKKGARDEALRVADRALHRLGDDPWLLSVYIELLVERDELVLAREALERALTLNPADADFLRVMADVLRRTGGSADDVADILRRLITTQPKSVEYHLALADVLASDGRYGQALEGLGSALQVVLHDPRLLARQAELLSQLGRHNEAIASAREALSQGGNVPQVATQLATSLLATGDMRGAVAAANQALRENRNLVAARRIRAFARFELGDFRKAIDDFRKVLAQKPEDTEALRVLLAAYERRSTELFIAADRGDEGRELLEQARSELEDALLLDSSNAGVHLILGQVLHHLGDYQAALPHLNFAVQANPESAVALGTRGKVRRKLGDPGAIDDLRRAADLNEDVPWVYEELGDALRLAGHYHEAQEVLRIAVDRDPSSFRAWACKGAAEFGADLYEEARKSLDRAIGLNQSYAWAKAVKASLLFKIDELEPALGLIEQALAEGRTPAGAWLLKGWLLDYLQPGAEEMEDAFRQAAARDANNLEALIGIGEALTQRSRVTEAKQYFEEAVRTVNAREKTSAFEFQILGWCLVRLGRYPDAIRALGEAASMDETLIEADFDLSLALLCSGDEDVALDEYKAAALRTQAIPNPGRRRGLIRLALRDIDAILPVGSEPPGLAEVYEILISVPTSTVDSSNLGEETIVKLLYIPPLYKCRTHGLDLTQEVQAKVEANGIPAASFGYRHAAKKERQTFRVKVRCPEDGGHDLAFRGTYGPE
jgi:tetratricopeptide (TPR) repeat protein